MCENRLKSVHQPRELRLAWLAGKSVWSWIWSKDWKGRKWESKYRVREEKDEYSHAAAAAANRWHDQCVVSLPVCVCVFHEKEMDTDRATACVHELSELKMSTAWHEGRDTQSCFSNASEIMPSHRLCAHVKEVEQLFERSGFLQRDGLQRR